MKLELPPLPYAKGALAPHLSARTLETHYEKHHKGYLRKLAKLVRGKPEEKLSLEELVRRSEGRRLRQRRPGLEPQLLLALDAARRRRPPGKPCASCS